MDSDEKLASVVGLGKSDPHMTREKDGEQEGGATNSSGRPIATKNERRHSGIELWRLRSDCSVGKNHNRRRKRGIWTKPVRELHARL